ncbi:MAG: hypothetical protein LIO65_00120 [Odoribacter sp.]|nr:hypothetical protein [Odoribacter sp.]
MLSYIPQIYWQYQRRKDRQFHILLCLLLTPVFHLRAKFHPLWKGLIDFLKPIF